MPCGYDLKKGEKICLEFKPPESCPVIGNYIIRVMERFEIRDSEGRLVKDLLNKEAFSNNSVFRKLEN